MVELRKRGTADTTDTSAKDGGPDPNSRLSHKSDYLEHYHPAVTLFTPPLSKLFAWSQMELDVVIAWWQVKN